LVPWHRWFPSPVIIFCAPRDPLLQISACLPFLREASPGLHTKWGPTVSCCAMSCPVLSEAMPIYSRHSGCLLFHQAQVPHITLDKRTPVFLVGSPFHQLGGAECYKPYSSSLSKRPFRHPRRGLDQLETKILQQCYSQDSVVGGSQSHWAPTSPTGFNSWE
jgi:hypothetical protein